VFFLFVCQPVVCSLIQLVTESIVVAVGGYVGLYSNFFVSLCGLAFFKIYWKNLSITSQILQPKTIAMYFNF